MSTTMQARAAQVYIGAHSRSVRPFDERHISRPGQLGGVFIRPLFQRRGVGRGADQQRGADQGMAHAGAFNELGEHLAGGVAVRDHPVLDWARDTDLARLAAGQPFRFPPYRRDLAVIGVERDHRRLIDHQAPPRQVDASVGGAEIDRQILDQGQVKLLK
jgi:hypothetical protein